MSTPGVCCKRRPSSLYDSPLQLDGRIKFEGLEALDIATAWVPHEGMKACNGKVGASYTGGGTWIHEIPVGSPHLEIAAGSYMRMPAGTPKEEDIGWMQGEGVLGFVIGKGAWWSKDVDEARGWILAEHSGFRSMPQKMKRSGRGRYGEDGYDRGLDKRGIRSADQGWVLRRGPRKDVAGGV